MRSVGAAEWRKNVVLFACSVALSVVVAEGLTAVFFPQNLGTWGMTRDGMTSHVPNASVYLHKFKQQITINSFGMRDREHVLKKPPQTLRILVLGDSFMEANQVAFEDSFASLLERSLRSRTSRDIEVINASVSGWGTDDELTYLTRYGFQFEPDIVLVGMTLHNDIQDNLQEEFHSFENGELQVRPVKPMPAFEYGVLQVKEYLASHSHLYQLCLKYARFKKVWSEGTRLNDHVVELLLEQASPELRRGWELTDRLFGRMKEECDRRGVRPIVFMIPLWVQVSEERLKEFLRERGESRARLALSQPQSVMKAIAVKNNLEVIDLLLEFQQWEKSHPGTLYLQEDGHWTVTGHQLAMETVAAWLLASESLALRLKDRFLP
jgi:SGNH hydrolase-like domain, acetyltransferase AlgX